MIDYNFSKEILSGLNFDLSKNSFLGSGTHGCAFLSSSNQVLKITSDYREYLFAQSIKGKNLKRVANIYESSILKPNVFLIVLEYVDTNLDYDLIYAFDDYLDILRSKKTFPQNREVMFWKKNITMIENELRKYNLFIRDLHWSNFGYKNSKLAIFDNSL